MEKGGKELKVSAIKNGTVLDHIPANQLFKVIKILGLNDCPNQITFGANLDSKRLGKKGIIKIADKFFEEREINKISLVAPDAKINIIRDFEVVEKKVIGVPEEIVGIVKCANPKCITNHQPITTKFHTIYDENGLKLHCHYCEKNTDAEDFKIII